MSIDQMDHYTRKLACEMDSWDVYVALCKSEPLVVVDGRSAEAYSKEHIPGSIRAVRGAGTGSSQSPHREICCQSTESLDKAITFVCYCDGIGCNASTKTR